MIVWVFFTILARRYQFPVASITCLVHVVLEVATDFGDYCKQVLARRTPWRQLVLRVRVPFVFSGIIFRNSPVTSSSCPWGCAITI